MSDTWFQKLTYYLPQPPSWPDPKYIPRKSPGEPDQPGPFSEHFNLFPYYPFGRMDPNSFIDPTYAVPFSVNQGRRTHKDPLILDLAGAGLVFSNPIESHASFSYQLGTDPVQTSWMTAGEGMLVHDLHPGQLQVTADEVFGLGSGDGINELAALDSNHDGKFDVLDAAYSSVKIWKDANLDGITDPGELVSLADAGVASIKLVSTALPSGTAYNSVLLISSFGFTRIDGSAGLGADVKFPAQHLWKVYTPASDFVDDPEALLLPQLLGYGALRDLDIATTERPALLAEEKALVLGATAMNGQQFSAAFEQFIEDWAEVGSLDPGSRGPDNNARHLSIVEQFYGQTWF